MTIYFAFLELISIEIINLILYYVNKIIFACAILSIKSIKYHTGGKPLKKQRILVIALVLSLLMTACGSQPKDNSISAQTDSTMKQLNSNVIQLKQVITQEEVETAANTAIALQSYIVARGLIEKLENPQDYTREQLDNIVSNAMYWLNITFKITDATDYASADKYIVNLAGLLKPDIAYASEPEKDLKKWAEELTKDYDKLRGPKRYEQLGKLLGTDARNAYEQMELAQEIIRNDALNEADYNDRIVKVLTGVKTTSSVVLTVYGFATTGPISGLSTFEKLGLVTDGIDAVMTIAETGAEIIWGEENIVGESLEPVRAITDPIFSLISWKNLDMSSLTKKTKDTAGALSFLGGSAVDAIMDGKVIGIQVWGEDDNGNKVINITDEPSKLLEIEKNIDNTLPEERKDSLIELIERGIDHLEENLPDDIRVDVEEILNQSVNPEPSNLEPNLNTDSGKAQETPDIVLIDEDLSFIDGLVRSLNEHSNIEYSITSEQQGILLALADEAVSTGLPQIASNDEIIGEYYLFASGPNRDLSKNLIMFGIIIEEIGPGEYLMLIDKMEDELDILGILEPISQSRFSARDYDIVTGEKDDIYGEVGFYIKQGYTVGILKSLEADVMIDTMVFVKRK